MARSQVANKQVARYKSFRAIISGHLVFYVTIVQNVKHNQKAAGIRIGTKEITTVGR